MLSSINCCIRYRHRVCLIAKQNCRSLFSSSSSSTAINQSAVCRRRVVPDHIPRPPYAENGVIPPTGTNIILKDEAMISRLRVASALASKVRAFAGNLVVPGVSTSHIDALVHEEITNHQAYPSPLNYSGFPKSVCTSVNSVLCHGIPDECELKEGDVVKIDVSVFINGVHGDCCGTFTAGKVSPQVQRVVDAAYKACHQGIAACKLGACLSDIGVAIENFASTLGLNVAENFVGHGIGERMHEAPHVLHTHSARIHSVCKLQAGMVFTIEPILCIGSPSHRIHDDGWTAATVDGSLAVQHEEMIAINADGDVELLTIPPK